MIPSYNKDKNKTITWKENDAWEAGLHTNIEQCLSWIIATHCRRSLNLPLESNRCRTMMEIWVACCKLQCEVDVHNLISPTILNRCAGCFIFISLLHSSTHFTPLTPYFLPFLIHFICFNFLNHAINVWLWVHTCTQQWFP